MIALKINQYEFVIKEGISILEACKYVGIQMPRFCYHDTLSIAGNCRMCLVKLEEDDKLIISCLTEAESDMEILSEDPIIKKAREEILEFLLLDHPLDCPICDQGGECDLQEQSRHFGSDRSKFYFKKQAVEDKNFSIFIKTIMTRCIHCTRCVRFSAEIAGIDFFGTLNRGNNTEIGIYSQNFFDSEISGTVIDLCPVGALTSKPYTFKARPWELKSIETIDVTDGLGSNIYINFSETNITRVLPKFNEEINENIISDKTRFSYDSFNSYNLIKSPIKKNALGSSKILTFLDTANELRLNLKISKQKSLFLISDDVSFENLMLLRRLNYLYPNVLIRSINTDNRSDNVFCNYENEINKLSDDFETIFLISINPRTECALVNSRLRYLSYNNYINIYNIGFKFDSVLQKSSFLNFDVEKMLDSIEGKNKFVSLLLLEAINPLIILGKNLNERGLNAYDIEFFLKKINNSIIFLKIFNNSNSTGLFYSGFKGVSTKDILNAENILFISCRESVFLNKYFFIKQNSTKIYWFNTHLLNYQMSNLTQIPFRNIYEETGIFFNLEFRPQQVQNFLHNKLNVTTFYTLLKFVFNLNFVESKSNNFIREFLKMPKKFSENIDRIYLELYSSISFSKIQTKFISFYPIKPAIQDFYRTNYFTDYSKNMQDAAKYVQRQNNNFF